MRRTGMDVIRDAAEAASLHLAHHPHALWLRIDSNRIEKLGTTPRLLRLHVDQRDKDTELVLEPLWKRIKVG